MQALGQTGEGTTVGVIDLQFSNYASSQPSCDLPSDLVIVDYTGTGTGAGTHGTNVADIVHEMTPGAALRLAKIGSENQLSQAVHDMVVAGTDVIVHNACDADAGGDGLANTRNRRAVPIHTIPFTSAGPLNADHLAHWSGFRIMPSCFPQARSHSPYRLKCRTAPDMDHGGTGRVYVINPRGDLKNVSWSSTGSGLRILIMPAGDQPLGSMKDHKICVAGGVANLGAQNVKAVDVNGNPVLGVTASVEFK